MEQLDLFQATYPTYKVQGKIKLIECFGGIGSQAKALEVLGANFCHHKLVEWAVPSIKAYNSIHIKDFTDYAANKTKEELIELVNGISVDYNQPLTTDQLQKKPIEWLKDVYNNMVATHDLCPDISRVKAKDLEIENEKTRQDTYILTYSFPCQDLSNAGKMAGMKKGANTRSGLLWEVERILYELKDLHQRPNVLIMENVQGVLSDIESWNSWLDSLTALGYTSYYKKTNSKNYGIPQNRLRVFMVSILGNYSYVFPRPIKLKYRLKDFLDKGEVDEKYYLSEKMVNFFQYNSEKQKQNGNGFEFKPQEQDNAEIGKAITTRSGSRMDDNFIIPNQRLIDTVNNNHLEDGTLIDTYNRATHNDIAGTITTRTDASDNTFVAVNRIGDLFDKEGQTHQAGSIYNSEGLAPTLDCSSNGGYRQPLIPLKRGYSCEVKEEQENPNGVDVIGNYSKSGYNQTPGVGKNGLAPTVTENHGQLPAITTEQENRGGS